MLSRIPKSILRDTATFAVPGGFDRYQEPTDLICTTCVGWDSSRNFDASNQQKVKQITRDYETASELWANIQAAETIGGKELDFMKQYFPSAVGAWEDMVGRI